MFVYMICHIDTLSVPRGWWKGRISTSDFALGPRFDVCVKFWFGYMIWESICW